MFENGVLTHQKADGRKATVALAGIKGDRIIAQLAEHPPTIAVPTHEGGVAVGQGGTGGLE
jgi:hypothetical protein